MKANELMIGDWVYRIDFKEPIPVCILGLEVVNYDTQPKQYIADVFCPKHNNNVGLYMDEICPIPLTAEILEKNGWSYNNEDAKYAAETWVGNGLMLQENGVGYRIVVVSDYDDEDTNYTPFVITDIHQLQHALRLAGIDYVQLEDSDILYKAEVMEFDVPLSESELYEQRGLESRIQDYWQDVRERAAIAAMQGVMNFFGSIDYNKETIAKLAVEQADALIEELKKK